MQPGDLHISLFNAYLEQNFLDKAANHLYDAFVAKTPIDIQNLLWLADFFLEKGDMPSVEKATKLLEARPSSAPESAICKLANLYAVAGRTHDQVALLETIAAPSLEAKLLLAEGYYRLRKEDRAVALFEEIIGSGPAVKNETSAAAALQLIRIRMGKPQADKAALLTQLKDLVLQKNFLNEPTHLEAALDYIDFSAPEDGEKRLFLLRKTKENFEQANDILSKDYHLAREQLPRKNRIYQGYLQFMDAEICLQQKELQGKGKTLLLQLKDEPIHPDLSCRVRLRLNELNGHAE